MIDFMKFKKVMSLSSMVLIIISFALVVMKGFNFSIDFTGGTLTELSFDNDIETEYVVGLLNKEYEEISVIHYGTSRNVVIQTPLDENYKGVGENIYKIVKDVSPDVKLIRTEFIGPKVGDELKTNGILSLVIVLLCVLVYISFRFEFKFAIGGIIALLHDLLITAGVISLFKINVDLTVLAAMLAILGYSLNDTIVVYDRVRENIGKFENKDLIFVVNQSLNETLSRTIMTSLTTSVTLISLLFFGGESLSAFSIVLLFGIIIGTYSSIYVASAALAYLNVDNKDFKKEKADTENGVI